MAVAYNPSIVTNGLVLYLDSRNSKSYSGSGGTWNDLSLRGLNATGSASFISSSDGALAGGSWTTASTNILNTDFHSIFFMVRFNSNVTYPNGWSGAWDKMFSYNAPGSDRSPGVWRYPSERRIHWRYDPANSGIDFYSDSGTTQFALNIWYHIGVTKNGATATAYVNGTSVTTATVSNPKTAGDATVIINEGFTTPLNNINCLTIYNRVLSAAEVQQNFITLKGRFGI